MVGEGTVNLLGSFYSAFVTQVLELAVATNAVCNLEVIKTNIFSSLKLPSR